jgi:hypothetical protein
MTSQPNINLVPVKQFSFIKDLTSDIPRATIAFDRDRVYVSTPDGVVLAGDSFESDFSPIFPSTGFHISNLYVFDHKLYVMAGADQAESDKHTMFASNDRGKTFTTIDDGLQLCNRGNCIYMVGEELYEQKGLLYANAGGGPNLQVSSDNGKTWNVLGRV